MLVDVLGSSHSKSWPLRAALQQVANADSGVVVIIRQPQQERAILNWMLRQPAIETEGEQPADLRKDGVGAQILMEVGVRKMQLMSAPKVYHGLAGFGLEIVEYVCGDQD
jgi:3,4-dihydroxy 2-butanone 4-phosphate synthase/GTP cyclohydrolase II